MKKLMSIALAFIVLIACDNGKLTNSKAERLIKKALKENPKEVTVKFLYLGEDYYYFKKSENNKNKKVEKLKKLERIGLIKMELLDSTHSRWTQLTTKKYNVSFTKKAQPFVVEVYKGAFGKEFPTLKLASLVLDKVKRVHEIPAMNIAEVTVDFKKVDKSFFYDLLSKDKSDFKTKKLMFSKSNEGWELVFKHGN